MFVQNAIFTLLASGAALAAPSLNSPYKLAVASPSDAVSNSVPSASGYQNGVYFTNWGIYARNYTVQELPGSKLTMVMYAFAQFDSEGTVSSSDPWADVQIKYPTDSTTETGTNAYGCVKQLYLQKKANRNMRVSLSIGGWTYSQEGKFAAAVDTAAKRANFAKTSVALVKDWGFDGIDIAWDYPLSTTEADNQVLLLKAIRSELDCYSSQYADGYHFLLTVASPAGPDHYNQQHLGEMAKILDFFNFMGYDYAGSAFSNLTAHQANVFSSTKNPKSTPFSTDAAITDYIKAGVNPAQIVLSMPTYGRAFDKTDGLGMSFTGGGSGSWEAGVWDYKVLPRANATEFVDTEIIAAYSYSPSTKELISYDTPATVKSKMEYVKTNGLGGGSFWEASGDGAGERSLIGASFSALGSIDTTQNLLSYPNSTYANIAAGMP